MKAEALKVAFGTGTDTTIELRFDVTARLQVAQEATTDWVLEVRVQGLGHRYHTFPNGTRYQVPHNKNHSFVIADIQRPDGLAAGDVWQTRWEATVDKHDVVVEDNDQYLFWTRLMPHVQISPTREVFASVREDID
ncbi:MAG TPA: hypothetical protein VK891_08160 [Euzebyales bacterium]|nr:hypothetical protein [Euzebyales bacterium]